MKITYHDYEHNLHNYHSNNTFTVVIGTCSYLFEPAELHVYKIMS